MSVPTTPAAQPPSGSYLPTVRESKLAGICEFYDRAIFVTGDTACSLLRRPDDPKVH